MRFLLDTHVLLWWMTDSRRLHASHRRAIGDSKNVAMVSSVTLAEIAIKVSLGKLDAPHVDEATMTDAGFTLLNFTGAHAAALRELPWHHRDPFDRMLVAQSLVEDTPLATVDSRIADYGVQLLG